jgi:hypothetical protein
MDTRTDAFSPQIYGNYPVLDSVLLHYLDIESLIQRHQVNPAPFETRESLNLLAQRFDLPPSRTFPAFLAGYDAKYATVRSYLLPNADPEAIILKAAEAGNLQAFYLGLQRNPKYKNPTFLDRALKRAARGGHPVMIDLIKDLGGTRFEQEVCGTAQGGHLEKLKLLIAQGKKLSPVGLYEFTDDAVKFGQLATVKYLTTLWTPESYQWYDLSWSAGASGDQGLIEYIMSQCGDNYMEVILGAIVGGYLEVVMQYIEKPGLDYSEIFGQAVYFNYLDLAKFVAQDHRINLETLNELMEEVKSTTTYETIDYLISLGGNDYNGLVSSIVIHDYIELFKRYYLSPGINYIETFEKGLKSSSVKVVKFMLEQELVPITVEELNSYLIVAGLNPELIELLFSLGATDYRSLVEKCLIRGDLELAKKYFDRAPGLKLNSVFKLCTKISVYRYLLSQGMIKQKTIDITLDRLERSKHNRAVAKKYLRSLSLPNGGSSSSD